MIQYLSLIDPDCPCPGPVQSYCVFICILIQRLLYEEIKVSISRKQYKMLKSIII